MTREVIFTLGDWSVCKMIEVNYKMINVFAHHTTCKEIKVGNDPDKDASEISWLVVDIDPICYACYFSVPDEIQALMQLHEWDTTKQGRWV